MSSSTMYCPSCAGRVTLTTVNAGACRAVFCRSCPFVSSVDVEDMLVDLAGDVYLDELICPMHGEHKVMPLLYNEVQPRHLGGRRDS